MDTGRQRTATAKWPLERGAAQTLESQVGSAGIQNVAFNMLRVTWNPLKQGGLPTFSMRSPMRPEDRRHPQIFQTRHKFKEKSMYPNRPNGLRPRGLQAGQRDMLRLTEDAILEI